MYAPLSREHSGRDYTKSAVSQVEQHGYSEPLPTNAEPSCEEQHVYWLYPCTLVGTFVLGVGAAAGHHFLYQHFNGIEATDKLQQNLHFAGLGLARLVTLLFTAGAALAFQQYVWLKMRKAALPVTSIDALFALTSSVLSLLQGGKTWKYATFAMLLAVFLNAIQIPSFVTPGTLTTLISTTTAVVQMNVPVAKMCGFGYEIRDLSSDYGNLTDCFAYYDVSNDRINTGLTRTVLGTSYAGAISTLISPCGARNCSYVVNYLAPTLKCDAIANPVSLTDAFPSLPAEYLTQAVLTGDGFFMAAGALDNAVNKSESELYPNYLQLNVTVLTGIRPIEYESYSCGFFNTSMLFRFTFSAGSFFVADEKEPEFLNEISLKSYVNDTSDFVDSITVYWEQIVSPIRGLVEGIAQPGDQIYDGSEVSPSGATGGNANFSSARLTSLRRYIYTGPDRVAAGYDPNAPGNAGTALEELSRNISVSMTLLGNWTASVPVSFYDTKIIFNYDRKTLVIAYAAAAVVAFCFCLIGAVALIRNGFGSDFSFSTILRTTRSPSLTSLARGYTSGAAPLSEEFGKTKLRFGDTVEGEEGHIHSFRREF